MGVDIQTYRCRIGTFKFACGTDVILLECLVDFSYGLKASSALLFIGLLLLMAGIEPNPGPIESGDGSQQEDRLIKVSGLPPAIDEDYLTIVFQNPDKQGGGKVKSIQINQDDHTAVIEFEDPSAVQIVLNKKPIKILDHELEIQTLPDTSLTLLVEGFVGPHSMQECLKSYFKNAEISIVEKGKAHLIFNSEKEAEKVLEKRCHTLKQPLIVSVIEPNDQRLEQPFNEQSSVPSVGENADVLPDGTLIKVSGLPPAIDEDYLTIVFQNPDKQGGGKVKSIQINQDDHTAVIEFEEPSAVQRVLMKRPITFLGHEVDVKAIEKISSVRVVVEGFGQVYNLEEYLKSYFDDQTLSGGETVDKIKITGKGRALVTFKSEDVIQRILEKKDHFLEIELEVYQIEQPLNETSTCSSTKDIGKVNEEFDGTQEFTQRDLNKTVLHEGNTESNEQPCLLPERSGIPPEAASEIFPEYNGSNKAMQKSTEETNADATSDIEIQTNEFEVNTDKEEQTQVFQNELDMSPTEKSLSESAEIKGHIETDIEQLERSNGQDQVDLDQITLSMGDQKNDNNEQLHSDANFSETTTTENKANDIIQIDNGETNVFEELDGQYSEVNECIEDFKENDQTHLEHADTNETNMTGKDNTKSDDSQVHLDQHNMSKKIEDILYSPTETRSDHELEVNLGTGRSSPMIPSGTCQDELQESRTNLSETNPFLQSNPLKGETVSTEAEKESVQHMLERLGLLNKYPEKITVESVTSIMIDDHIESNCELSNVPWKLLRQIVGVQSQARDLSISELETETKHDAVEVGQDIFSCLDETMADEELCALDVFNLTLECCDKLLKQLLYKKLHLCKIAVPFLYIDRLSLECKISLWPLRSMTVLNNPTGQSDLANKEFEITELPVNTFTFARLSIVQFSKSKMLNSLISDQSYDTFFNEDCPSGSAGRQFSKGIIELCCLPVQGDKKDKFNNAVTFFNMRGSLLEDFNDNTIALISQLSDVIVLVVTMKDFEINTSYLNKLVNDFHNTIFIVDGPLDTPSLKKLKQYRDLSKKHVCLVQTYNMKKKRNLKEIAGHLIKEIMSVLATPVSSIETRLKGVSISKITIDETETNCVKGRLIAEQIYNAMETSENTSSWKEIVIPASFLFSRDIGACIKKLFRLKNIGEVEKVENEIDTLHRKQIECISTAMRLFTVTVVENVHTLDVLQYTFGWLNNLLEREKRKKLPSLVEENRRCWEKMNELKQQQESSEEVIQNQIKLTEDSQAHIEDASLGIEHLFRELGHIYDALIALSKTVSPHDVQLPPVNEVVESVAELVFKGQPFELVDGDGFFMPKRWTQAVLQHVSNKLHHKKVLALSVLGLQSSGKSTLLNAMFGSQFPVKSGRCTRGIHIQLLPIKSSKSSSRVFDYVLVIDTEGLRAPEISSKRQNHDNELSTVITGLGDITLLNIMGENTSEIRDILQIVVHAFLRLKLVNKSLDISKSFYLLHQNVSDIAAADNMRTGLQVLLKTLDNVTKEAAEAEGIKNITTFNQVIEFDIGSNVWFLPNFWQGIQPMARVNTEYSERLHEKKCELFQKALKPCNKSYQTLTDISLHIHDLWKGVLTEDFVYCFRNSIEIKAYMQLEETLKEYLIKLEIEVEDQRIDLSQKEFSKCHEQTQLQSAFDKIVINLQNTLTEEKTKVETVMENFFESNDYSDTILQWKDNTLNRITFYCSELEVSMKNETARFRKKTEVDIFTFENSKKHEKELYERSLLVAKQTKGKSLTDNEIHAIFEETWSSVLSEIMSVSMLDNNQASLKDGFIKCLFDDIFTTEKMILKQELEKRGVFLRVTEDEKVKKDSIPEINTLLGSFHFTGILKEDISFNFGSNGSEESMFKMVEDEIEGLFVGLDVHVEQCCQTEREITQTDVKKILLETKNEVDRIQKGKTDFTLKTTATVKLFIHISFYVQSKYDKHNLTYQQSRGIKARLQEYKLQVKEHFVGYVKNRKAEETAAKQISLILENNLRKTIKERLPVAVKKALLNSMTHLKFHLILEMLEEMTNNDDFESFIEYIKHPKIFAKKWIRKKSEDFLFHADSMKYSEIAAKEVTELYDNVRGCVKQTTDALESDSSSLTQRWVEHFTGTFFKCSFNPSMFLDAIERLEMIEDINNFTTCLLEHIEVSKEKLIKEFKKETSALVKWSGINPYEDLIEKAWGCPEQCAFCGEPCAKDKNHEGTKHYSLQHRLSCCMGVRHRHTNEASITSCSYDVQSEQQHNCGVFNFACNPIKRKSCSTKWHPYRDYRTYLPNWDIEPNSNMDDCAKFWLWFVGTYKSQLAAHYIYKVCNVPKSWSDITKAEALENLRRIYTGN